MRSIILGVTELRTDGTPVWMREWNGHGSSTSPKTFSYRSTRTPLWDFWFLLGLG